MPQIMRRSLLIQLVSVYLLFVATILGAGVGVNTVIEQRLRHDVEASDQALAQEIALDTGHTLLGAETAVVTLGQLAQGANAHNANTHDAVTSVFQAFIAARSDVEHVYWLDPLGAIVLSVKSLTSPPDNAGVGAEFSPPGVVQRALTATTPVFEVGIAQETNGAAGVIIAAPVRDQTTGRLQGIVVISLSLEELSAPLAPVVDAQQPYNRHLLISIIDEQGVRVASSQHDLILQTALNSLPGAKQALQGQTNSQSGPGSDGQDWFFSSVPVQDTGWAVVVQRPTGEVFDIVTQLHLWLFGAVAIFAIGVVVFWLLLLNRLIRPLHTLALLHHTVPTSQHTSPLAKSRLSAREDEVGGLARSLERLERDVHTQLGELRTLLETSNAVVGSLEPHKVVGTIIREARRLVDVQAAAVLAPDEQGALRVLASEGHSERYDRMLSLSPENVSSAAVLALRDGRPVQKLLDPARPAPSLSSEEGFRAVLAIPVISRHVGGVVLLVHRAEPHLFSGGDIDLLLTFANYATLAWEHAVLYARSDERLREEKQRLEAIMGSMSDGLVLADADGHVLYANPGAALLTGLSSDALARGTISSVHEALCAASGDSARYQQAVALAETGERPRWTIETGTGASHRALALLLFDVRDEAGEGIGRGLLLRDVTLEREADEFKTTLLAAVGHELRTPLTAIKGHASTLLQEDVTWSPDEQRHSLRTISAEVDQLTDLVRDLLDLSRQYAGMLPLHRETWRLEDVLAGALRRLSQPPTRLEVDLPSEVPLVEVDRARIEVVLRNLLANAVAYGGAVARVAARAHADGMVEMTVSDDGPPIEPEDLPHVFERFYRASRGVQRRAQGTGLGLAICKAFVEAHGGVITAESGSAGTTIRFTLPAALRAPFDETAEARQPNGHREG